MKKIKLLEINDGGILRQDEMRNIHGGLSSGTGSGVGIYKCVCRGSKGGQDFSGVYYQQADGPSGAANAEPRKSECHPSIDTFIVQTSCTWYCDVSGRK